MPAVEGPILLSLATPVAEDAVPASIDEAEVSEDSVELAEPGNNKTL